MSIVNEIEELVGAGVISQDSADKIEQYYRSKNGSSSNILFIVFGILGAILVGLGIILILAHNWDQLSRVTKTIFAFLPLIVGQVLGGYVLLHKLDNTAWRESVSVFLFFAIGASISLVSQIYNIPGDMTAFILTWMLLALPLIYVLKSSVVSLLYHVGILYYGCNVISWGAGFIVPSIYWVLLMFAMPHYYFLCRDFPKSNFTIFHNWVIPISIAIGLSTVTRNAEALMFVTYYSLWVLFLLIGESSFMRHHKLRNNGYKVIGTVGAIVILLSLSFSDFWEHLRARPLSIQEWLVSTEFIAFIIILFGILLLGYRYKIWQSLKGISPLVLLYGLFVPTFFLGLVSPFAVVLMNLYVFVIGVLMIREGAQRNHLGIVNFGLLIVVSLVMCRFVDIDLSFVIRGILFVSLGVGFFMVNYWMLKKRRIDG